MDYRKAIACQIRKQKGTACSARGRTPDLRGRLGDTVALKRTGTWPGTPTTTRTRSGRTTAASKATGSDRWAPRLASAMSPPDREWCKPDTQRVPVESKRRGGDRVATDVRCFRACLPPGPSPGCRRCASTGPSKRPPPGHGRGLGQGRQPPAQTTPPATGPSPAHRPQTSPAGPIPKVDMAQKRLAAAWNQGLPAPTDRSQAQTRLDAIALCFAPVLAIRRWFCCIVARLTQRRTCTAQQPGRIESVNCSKQANRLPGNRILR